MKTIINNCQAILLLLLTSCTSQLYMKSVKPAEFALPKQEKVILIAQVYDPLVAHKDQAAREVYYMATKQAMISAFEGLKNAPYTQVQLTSQLVNSNNKDFATALSSSTILELTAQYQATHVLAFQGISVKKTINLTPENFSEVDYLPSFDALELQGTGTAPKKMAVKSIWVLYDGKGNVIDEVEPLVRKSVILNEAITTSKAVMENYLTKATETIQAAAKSSGEQVAARYFPQVRVVNRLYYKWGALAEAAEWIEVKNWKEATSLLQPLTEAESPNVARKAAYNLAVIAEAQGNLQLAQQWAERASKAGDQNAEKMLLQLNQIL